MGTEIIKVRTRDTLENLITQNQSQFGKLIKPEQMLKTMLALANKNPDIWNCTTTSLASCMITLSETGLNVTGAKVEAHIVPFGEQAVLIVDYKGQIRMLMEDDPDIDFIQAEVILEGESYEAKRGRENYISHTPDLIKRSGLSEKDKETLIIGAYAILVRKNSANIVWEFMGKSEILEIKNRSKSKSKDVWNDHPTEMFKKTVVHRLFKWQPFNSTRFQKVMESEAVLYEEDANGVYKEPTSGVKSLEDRIGNINNEPARQKPVSEAKVKPEVTTPKKVNEYMGNEKSEDIPAVSEESTDDNYWELPQAIEILKNILRHFRKHNTPDKAKSELDIAFNQITGKQKLEEIYEDGDALSTTKIKSIANLAKQGLLGPAVDDSIFNIQ